MARSRCVAWSAGVGLLLRSATNLCLHFGDRSSTYSARCLLAARGGQFDTQGRRAAGAAGARVQRDGRRLVSDLSTPRAGASGARVQCDGGRPRRRAGRRRAGRAGGRARPRGAHGRRGARARARDCFSGGRWWAPAPFAGRTLGLGSVMEPGSTNIRSCPLRCAQSCCHGHGRRTRAHAANSGAPDAAPGAHGREPVSTAEAR